MSSAAVVAATLTVFGALTYAVTRWGGMVDDPSVGLLRPAWRNRPTPARLRARWRCVLRGHEYVPAGAGCGRCRHINHSEPTLEVR